MTKFIGTPLRGIEFANPGDEAISSRVSGDTQPRLRIDAGGRITWSDGTNSGDTVLFRSSANALTTYDSLTASAGLITLTTNGIPNQSLPNGAIAIDTTNHVFYFRSNNEWLEVSGGATVTVSDTAPVGPEIGDLWYSSLELELFIYYSNAWIQLTDAQGGVQELYELSDVLIDDPLYGQTLVYNGTEWENDFIPTAQSLQTARAISLAGDVSGSVAFDGSQNVSISATIQPNSVSLGTDTTGNYVSDLTAGTGVTVTHTPGEGSSPTVAIGQVVGTSASVTFANVTSDLIGNVTGNVTGNVSGSSGSTTGNANTATALQNARAISLSGDVSGSVSFNGTSDVSITATIQPNSVALGTDTTGNYMSALTQGTGVTITHTPGEGSNATIAIGQAVGTSASVTFANLTVTGDLTVSGTTTSINTETLTVDDNIIILNNNATGAPSQNAGIEVERGSSTNVALRWNETSDKWEITEDGSAYLEIATTTDISAAAVTSISDIPGVVTGYQIGGTGPAGGIIFITPDTAGNFTGKYFEVSPSASQVQRSWSTGTNQSVAVSGADSEGFGFGVQNTAEIAAQSGNVSATSAAVYASEYEYGGFSDWFLPSLDELNELYAVEGIEPGIIPGLLGSNYWSSTEHSATQAKYENLGDGGQGFSAKSNALYVRPVRAFNSPAYGDFFKWSGSYWTNDQINLGTDTTGNYMSDLTQGTGVTITHTPGEGSNATIAIGQAVGTSSSVQFAAVTAPLIGNASTATTLQTARTITLGGDLGGSASFDGSSDVTLTATVAADSIALGTDTTGNYMSDLTQGTGVTITHTPGEGSNATIAIGQAVSTSSSVTFANVTATGNVAISGRIDKTTIRESVADTSVSASVVTADYATGDIFYVGTAPSSNFTVNLTNAPTDNGKAITVVIFVTQGATGYYPNVVQVAGSAQTIKWANGAAPTPTSSAGKIDIFSFTFVRRSSAWTVFGSSNLGY